MPEIPETLKPRLQAWWSALDDGTHTIFEAIYLEAPAAVSRAISGGQWVADAAEPGLAAQLGEDRADGSHHMSNIPTIVAPEPVQVQPYHAAPGQKVRFTWTEQNQAPVGLDGYYTDVYVQTTAGETIGSTRLTNPAIAGNASAERSFEFEGTETAGDYQLLIYINAEGSDPGVGVPGPQGYRSATMASFGVGADESQASRQDGELGAAAMNALQTAVFAQPPSGAVPHLVEALNWLAALQLSEEEAARVEQLVLRLGQLPEPYLQAVDGAADEADPRVDDFRAKLQRLSGALNSGVYDQGGRRTVLDAIDAVATQPGA